MGIKRDHGTKTIEVTVLDGKIFKGASYITREVYNKTPMTAGLVLDIWTEGESFYGEIVSVADRDDFMIITLCDGEETFFLIGRIL